MIVHVDVGSGSVRLEDPAGFKQFHIVASSDDATVAAALGPDGRAAGNDHVWVRIGALEGWAGDAVDDAWREGFATMITFATSKGWVDETGEFVQAHIQREEAQKP